MIVIQNSPGVESAVVDKEVVVTAMMVCIEEGRLLLSTENKAQVSMS